MNYTEQRKYLIRGRVWAAGCVFLTAWAYLTAAGDSIIWSVFFDDYRMPLITSAIIVAALTGSLFYTPDYLHLNVNLHKRARWQIKIRWRLIAAVLAIGLLSASSLRQDLMVLASCAWLVAANLGAKRAVPARFSSLYFWGTDSVLLGTLLWTVHFDFLLATVLIVVSAHLAVVTTEKAPLAFSTLAAIAASQLTLAVGRKQNIEWDTCVFSAGLIVVSTLATGILVARAQRQNDRNFRAAVRELQDFMGYSEEEIRELWATSNEQLAKNWKDAQLDESNREEMTAWYRENSELYMFAISGYNLEYKRIRDSIKMLRYGRGACLDYGAGNGEIILELARRGHPAIYFDVAGTSMRFARQRAERQKLAVEFLYSKEDLAASAKQRGLDTIFSFDVLEHLPDLPGELKFLSSLLNPGGRMVFDVPAGSTKSHPMHLNHDLDIHAHMTSIGMVEERSVWQSIPFRKQEKYVFRKQT